MAPASFYECLYFLKKTTLQWILEVVTHQMQVSSSQLIYPPAVIYGRDIFYEDWHCRFAEMGVPISESLIFDRVVRISLAFRRRGIGNKMDHKTLCNVYIELRPA